MTNHVWSLICRESKIEQDTNNISIIDAYESMRFDIQSPTPPTGSNPVGVPINFEIVSLFFRDKKGTEESINEMITVQDPSGKKLGEFKFGGQFKSHQERLRIRMKFDSIALTTSGLYLFQVYQGIGKDKHKLVSSIPLSIEFFINNKEVI